MWPLLTCQGESVAEAERHADGAAPEIEHLLGERLIEERVVDGFFTAQPPNRNVTPMVARQ